MSTVILYHNPRCSKSRQALALLEERGITPTIMEYLKTPFDEKTLQSLLTKLHMKPRELMRQGESLYKELGLDDPQLSDLQLLQQMVKHPILIERPIVVVGHKAIVARPPEKIAEILEK